MSREMCDRPEIRAGQKEIKSFQGFGKRQTSYTKWDSIILCKSMKPSVLTITQRKFLALPTAHGKCPISILPIHIFRIIWSSNFLITTWSRGHDEWNTVSILWTSSNTLHFIVQTTEVKSITTYKHNNYYLMNDYTSKLDNISPGYLPHQEVTHN